MCVEITDTPKLEQKYIETWVFVAVSGQWLLGENIRGSSHSHTNADIICLEYSMFNGLKYLDTILMMTFICLYRSSLKNYHVKFISPTNPPTRKHKSQQNPQLLLSPRQPINKFSIIFSKGNTAYMEWVLINSLGPSDAIWWQRSGSTFAQVMACCLTAPSHYLNQCWLIKSKALWHFI